jgi:hypothetical protein
MQPVPGLMPGPVPRKQAIQRFGSLGVLSVQETVTHPLRVSV